MLGCCICLEENIKLYTTKCCHNPCLCRDCALKQHKHPCPLCRGETAIWIRRNKQEILAIQRQKNFKKMCDKIRRPIYDKYNDISKLWDNCRITFFQGRYYFEEDILKFSNLKLLDFYCYFRYDYWERLYQELWKMFLFSIRYLILSKMT